MKLKKIVNKIFIVLLLIFVIWYIYGFVQKVQGVDCGDFTKFHKMQILKNNSSHCDTTEFEKRGFYDFLGNFACRLENGENFRVEDCFIDIAKESQNVSNCDWLGNRGNTGSSYKDACFKSIRVLESEECDNLIYEENKKMCLVYVNSNLSIETNNQMGEENIE